MAVEPVTLALKELGFRKRRGTFNRLVDDGMTHVITYQRSLYSPESFTINLGVHVPSMSRVWPEDSAWYNETACQLRWRISEILEEEDHWWSAKNNADIRASADALLGPGLLMLARYTTAESIVQAHIRGGRSSIGRGAASDLDFVDLYEATGHHDQAKHLLIQEIARASGSDDSSWVNIVNEYLVRRGKTGFLIEIA